MTKFELGKVVQTRLIFDTTTEDNMFANDIQNAFKRYSEADWGITCEDDKLANDEAITSNNDRIVAKYPTCKGEIFIITEADRSATTILFCSEY